MSYKLDRGDKIGVTILLIFIAVATGLAGYDITMTWIAG